MTVEFSNQGWRLFKISCVTRGEFLYEYFTTLPSSSSNIQHAPRIVLPQVVSDGSIRSLSIVAAWMHISYYIYLS